MSSERSLVFIKPDGVVRRRVGASTLEEILEENLAVSSFGSVEPRRSFFRDEHYSEHQDRFFFDWLIDYVTAGPILSMEVSGDNAIRKLRDLLGETVPGDANSSSIRGRFGIEGGVNVAHASDSRTSSKRERKLWKEILEAPGEGTLAVEEYIQKYREFPVVETTDYRVICRDLREGQLTEGQAKEQLQEFLDRESDTDEQTQQRLASVIVRNSQMRGEEE